MPCRNLAWTMDNNRDEAVDDWDPIEEDSEGEDEEEEGF